MMEYLWRLPSGKGCIPCHKSFFPLALSPGKQLKVSRIAALNKFQIKKHLEESSFNFLYIFSKSVAIIGNIQRTI
jgi:hypothetical protein